MRVKVWWDKYRSFWRANTRLFWDCLLDNVKQEKRCTLLFFFWKYFSVFIFYLFIFFVPSCGHSFIVSSVSFLKISLIVCFLFVHPHLKWINLVASIVLYQDPVRRKKNVNTWKTHAQLLLIILLRLIYFPSPVSFGSLNVGQSWWLWLISMQ